MTQWKKLSLYAATAAVAGFMMAACGEEGPVDGLTCTDDSTCGTGQICHPTAKQCVTSCTAGSDCPDTAKTCDSLGGATDGGSAAKFCQCSTDALCGGGEGSSAICSKTFKICATKCSDNSGCPSGFTCDTASGDCVNDCTQNSSLCSATQYCDTATKACVAAKCDPANTTVDNTTGKFGDCAYGTYCKSQSEGCVAVLNGQTPDGGSCAEAVGLQSWAATQTHLGPVIVSATATRLAVGQASEDNNGGTPGSTECLTTEEGVLITAKVYTPGGLTTHTNVGDWQNHAKLKLSTSPGGTVLAAPGGVRTQFDGGSYVESLQYVTLCGVGGTSQLAIQLIKEDGGYSNPVCLNY